MSEDKNPYFVLFEHAIRASLPGFKARLERTTTPLDHLRARVHREEMSLEEWTTAVDALLDDIEQRHTFSEGDV